MNCFLKNVGGSFNANGKKKITVWSKKKQIIFIMFKLKYFFINKLKYLNYFIVNWANP